ncbi:uncharacterized protein LOC119837553 [Zerene cesonia]|uniref:uncharacterized protein LOC119837553 n=1 Tax=Zerene cesonia TaxID=33412 RepID=UPI0018E565C4|nr:uncharacterized protein LOC119837553 [Zerene cesonia]
MPKVLESAAREVIFKVKLFCEAEKKNKGVLIPLINVTARVAAMAGVSKQTVCRIAKEDNLATKTSNKIVAPPKSRANVKKKVLKNVQKKKIAKKDIAQAQGPKKIIALTEAANGTIISKDSLRLCLSQECGEGTSGTIISMESCRHPVSGLSSNDSDNDNSMSGTAALSDHNYL